METQYFGDRQADTVLIQIVGEHDFGYIDEEIAKIKAMRPNEDFLFVTVQVDNWNDDLSPWPAPPVWWKEAFAGNAQHTLTYLEFEVLAPLLKENPERKLYLGGYSLSGMFVLWAAYNMPSYFEGIAAVSPSVWFPNLVDFIKANRIKTKKVYLSIGVKEEKADNKVLAQVGGCIRAIYEHLKATDISCCLKYNPGSHFNDPDSRMADGFEWLWK